MIWLIFFFLKFDDLSGLSDFGAFVGDVEKWKYDMAHILFSQI